MGGCLSLLIIANKSHKNLSATTSSSSSSATNIITITGEFRQFTTPISVSQVLEQTLTSSSESFICNSNNLYYDEHIPALNSNQELQPGHIYFILANTKLAHPLSTSDMAALAIKASAALSSNKNTSKSRSSPVLLSSSMEVDDKNCVCDDDIELIKMKRPKDKQHDIGISRSVSIKKLQRYYSSRRVKLAARSFRLKLNTVYEGSVLLL